VDVVMVLAHPDPSSLCAELAEDVRSQLSRRGHAVRLIDLDREGFDPVMTADERIAYETEEPILDPVVRRHADLVKQADAMVFVYPTVTGGLPAQLKGWFERVMVSGVAFELEAKTNKIRPALRNIRRIGVITTSDAGRAATAVVNDSGRRTLHRTLRLMAHPMAKRTFLALYRSDKRSEPERNIFKDRVHRAMTGWT